MTHEFFIGREQELGLLSKALRGFETTIGLQSKNLILNNRKSIHAFLGLDPNNIIHDNPYIQNTTTKQQGCQIDYLIQTKYKTLYACEVKFSINKIGGGIIKEVQQKIDRLCLPKGFACLPVLIVANGVENSVVNKDYFFKIIDMAALLQMKS